MLHGRHPSPQGWLSAMKDGHETFTWGCPRPKGWVSCDGCQAQRQVVSSRRADLVICTGGLADSKIIIEIYKDRGGRPGQSC